MSAQVLDNEGTHTVQISHRDGKAIMHFERPVRWCALDPATAAQFAEAFARAAYTAVAGDTPTPQHSQITDQKRVRAVREVEIMLGSFEREAPRPEHKIAATRIVDACLRQFS